MLDFKVTEELLPNEELLTAIEKYHYTVINGAVKVVLKTNLQFISPTIYLIRYPVVLTIHEYKVNEISNKPFYIKEHNQKYNIRELKELLRKV